MEALNQIPLQAKPELTVVKPQVKPTSVSLAEIRAMFGRKPVALAYNNLTIKQKAIVLYGAKLKPADFIQKKFETFTSEEREEIRKALIAIRELSAAFGNLSLGRADVMPVKKVSVKHSEKQKPNVETDELNALNSLIAEIAH